MRFLLTLFTVGSLSLVANAQTAKLECLQQKIKPDVNVTGDNSTLVAMIEKELSENTLAGPITINIFDDYVQVFAKDSKKYAKVEKNKYKNETSYKGYHAETGDYDGTTTSILTLMETSSLSIYNINFEVTSITNSAMQGYSKAVHNTKLTNCKLSKE